MMYNYASINNIAYAYGKFRASLIDTPAWFQTFWDHFVIPENFNVKDDSNFRLRVEKLYEKLAPLFDQHETIKNSADLKKIYAIYIKTIISFYKELSRYQNLNDFAIKMELARKIAEIGDLDFLRELLLSKDAQRELDNSLVAAIFYLNVADLIQNHVVDSRAFLIWFAAILIDLSSNSLCFLDRHCIRGVASIYCLILDPFELEKLFPACNPRQKQDLCIEIVECALLNCKQDVADYFWELTPDKTHCLDISVDEADTKEYKKSKHYYINSYLYNKTANPEFAYDWAMSYALRFIPTEKDLQSKLIRAAAKGGCLPAIEYIINNYQDTTYFERKIDMSAHMPEFVAILKVGASKDHVPSITLLVSWLHNGTHTKQDLPGAIHLYAKLNDHQSIVKIYRSGPRTIRNEFAAQQHEALASAQVPRHGPVQRATLLKLNQ